MSKSTIAKLMEYQSQGYLFHGSPNGEIKILEPRETKDVDPTKTFNSDKAVFASSLALVTIIFGVVPERSRMPEGTRNLVWYTKWPNGEVSSRIPISWKNIVESNVGFVYVMASDTFTQNWGTQYKSKTAVVPVDKLEVKLSDFLSLGGNVEWI